MDTMQVATLKTLPVGLTSHQSIDTIEICQMNIIIDVEQQSNIPIIILFDFEIIVTSQFLDNVINSSTSKE